MKSIKQYIRSTNITAEFKRMTSKQSKVIKEFLIFLVIQLCLLALVIAQEDEELVGFDFTHSGKGEYNNAAMSLQKYDLRFNLPVVTKKKDIYLMHDLEMGRSNYKYGNSLAKNEK